MIVDASIHQIANVIGKRGRPTIACTLKKTRRSICLMHPATLGIVVFSFQMGLTSALQQKLAGDHGRRIGGEADKARRAVGKLIEQAIEGAIDPHDFCVMITFHQRFTKLPTFRD
ncbi:MAG: hypothetical protein P1U62_05745 [Alteraurantiacibacter sp. bin_em_oilr2.035]|nr:hypothetical protein [Alteraurantiacibacter sp. bin_em_oilr2.035]